MRFNLNTPRRYCLLSKKLKGFSNYIAKTIHILSCLQKLQDKFIILLQTVMINTADPKEHKLQSLEHKWDPEIIPPKQHN